MPVVGDGRGWCRLALQALTVEVVDERQRRQAGAAVTPPYASPR